MPDTISQRPCNLLHGPEDKAPDTLFIIASPIQHISAKAVKETRIGTDQGRANRLSGKEGKGAWLGCWRADCCGMGNGCEATHKGMGHLQSDHEEADTRMVLHALDATNDGATKLSIHSPNPDVLVLAIRRYLEMCPNTSVVTRKGTNHRFIMLQPLVLLRQPRCPHLTPSQELIILVAF